MPRFPVSTLALLVLSGLATGLAQTLVPPPAGFEAAREEPPPLQQAITFAPTDGYQVVSQGGHSRIANGVDPNYTVVAKFPKRLLPPKR